MQRLCKTFHIIETGHGGAKVFMPGMIYDIKEFRAGEALVNGIWAPDYIFEPCEINELDNRGA